MRRLFKDVFGLAAVGAVFLIPAPANAADPTTIDCLNANNSSVGLRNDHKLRAARDRLLVCSAKSCPVDIRKECLRRVDDVNASLPTIVFEATDAAGKDLSAVKVTMDGETLAERLDGTALTVDPGEHTFVFETAGLPRLTARFVLRESQKDRREAITFAAAPSAAAGPVRAPPPAEPPTDTVPAVPSAGAEAPPSRGAPWLPITLLGVGGAGIAAGAVFTFIAHDKRTQGDQLCPGGTCPGSDHAQIASLDGDATTAGQIGVASFVVGGLAAAAGATLFVLRGRGATSTGKSARLIVAPWVGLGAGGVVGELP
jgi:hypothetical protein